jgi:ribosomal protein S25
MPPETPPVDSASVTPAPELPQPVPEPARTPVEAQTAQIPANEPIAPASEPIPPSPPVSIITPVVSVARDLLVKARAVIQSRKRKKLDKILAELTKKGSITNDQVEKLLHVSDATATRYLSQLEKEGKIQQVGETGKSVKYLKF